MAYIKDFAVKNLKKNAVVEFFEYVMSLVELCQSLKTNLPEQYAALKNAAAEVQKWGELTLKSNLTAKIRDLDSQRDSYLIALEHALKALVKSLDPETREKAIAVQNKYNSINVPREAQYFQESGAIDRLLGALLGEEMLPDVTAIGVLPIVNMLKAANDAMHQLLLERGIDEAQIPEKAFETARRAAESVYRDFVFMVNAYIAMYVERAGQTDAELATFVQNLNQFLHKYKITQFKSASKSEDATTPPDTDTDGTEGEEQQPGNGGSEGGETGGGNQQPGGSTGGGTGGSTEGGGSTGGETSTKKTVTYRNPDTGEVLATQEYEVGETIVPPTPPTGFVWGYYPDEMPDRDVTVDALPDVIDF